MIRSIALTLAMLLMASVAAADGGTTRSVVYARVSSVTLVQVGDSGDQTIAASNLWEIEIDSAMIINSPGDILTRHQRLRFKARDLSALSKRGLVAIIADVNQSGEIVRIVELSEISTFACFNSDLAGSVVTNPQDVLWQSKWTEDRSCMTLIEPLRP